MALGFRSSASERRAVHAGGGAQARSASALLRALAARQLGTGCSSVAWRAGERFRKLFSYPLPAFAHLGVPRERPGAQSALGLHLWRAVAVIGAARWGRWQQCQSGRAALQWRWGSAQAPLSAAASAPGATLTKAGDVPRALRNLSHPALTPLREVNQIPITYVLPRNWGGHLST